MNTFTILVLSCFVLISGGLAESNAPLSEYVSVSGKYLPGPLPQNSVKIERGVSLGLCAAKCTVYFRMKTFPCYAFEYTPGSQMCVYTNVTTLMINGGFLGLKDNSAINYYERTKGAYSNLFHGTPGVALKDQSNYYSIRYNSTLEQCSFECLLNYNATCMSFSFSSKTGVCGQSKTYHSSNNGIALTQTSLYNHYQYYTSWPCNATFPKNYGPRVLASPRFPYKSVTHINCFAKLEAPEGKQIQIVFSTFYLRNSVCQQTNLGITVHDGESEAGPVLARLCGNSRNIYTRTSTSGSLYLNIRTEDSPLAFKALYNFVEVKKKPCDDNKCINGATCIPTNSSFVCACVQGYTGTYCEQDIDECASSPCYFGATCLNLLNKYHCQCPKQFTGDRCERFMGSCGENPCQHGVCSIVGQNGYQCQCDQGFTGKNCSVEIKPCMSGPCIHGNCTDQVDTYYCTCQVGYTGKNCDQMINFCDSNPCMQGNCSSFIGGYSCTCNAGFTGDNCDTVINHCQNITCNNGFCVNLKSRFRCQCSEGYRGSFCEEKIDHCKSSPCRNGGLCINDVRGFSCVCNEGFTGSSCNVTIDYCSFSPCRHGNCINTINGFTCVCNEGYSGMFCDVPSCENITCGNHGKCQIIQHQPICKCDAYFTGTSCENEIDACQIADCGYGLCSKSAGGYKCFCAEGYTGSNCKEPVTLTPTTVQTPNLCKNNSCQNGGRCKVKDNGYTCHCLAPYTGNHCEILKNDCWFSPCYSGSTCVDLSVGNHICLCPKGMTGEACDVTENACSNVTCKRGHCESHGSSYRCVVAVLSGTGNTTINMNGFGSMNLKE